MADFKIPKNKEINEFLKNKPCEEELSRLYAETQYEKIKMICSWHRDNKQDN